jgi:hypothetical protein
MPRTLGPYLALMVGGFVVGVIGHVIRSRWLVTIGVLMFFLATLLLPLLANVVEQDRPNLPPGYPE